MDKDQAKLPAGCIAVATDYLKLSHTCGSKKDEMGKEKGNINQQRHLQHSLVTLPSSSATPVSTPSVICKDLE